MSHRLEELPDDVEELKALLLQREELLSQRDLKIEAQRTIIDSLRRIVFGRRSERRARDEAAKLHPGQGTLFHAELLADAERTAKEKQVQGEITVDPPKKEGGEGDGKGKGKKGRRSKFPSHLPRIRTRYELEDEACRCEKCGGSLHEIGCETTSELERLETAVIHEIQRAKYACRQCGEGVKTAPGPDRVIEKGLLGPGFLASVAVERFGNHMPYYRLEKKYASEGLALSRSVLERSMKTLAEILSPIRRQLLCEILEAPALFTDDTPVRIAMPRDGGRSRQGRVWIYLDREGRHAYDFTESRKRDGPLRVLGAYTGFVHADAYPGYDPLYFPEGATEVACWAHVRRKFLEARSSEKARSDEAVERIGELYEVERAATARGLNDEERRDLRQRFSVGIANALFAWMKVAENEVLPKSPMARALKYALTLEEALRRYLEDGSLSIDNNAAERAMRPVAIGRKNWLFFQREGGGDTAVVLLSLIATAKAIGVDPRLYLRDVMLRIARESDVAKLTPHGWRRHFQAEVEAEREAAMARFMGE